MIDEPIPFGRYLLVDKLATGGMAEIFQAKLVGVEGFEKTLVIKRILPIWSERVDFVSMLVDEAKVLVHLNHPNIVQIYELGRVGATYFIAMEYVEGMDLRKFVQSARQQDLELGQDVILTIIAEALAGLQYAHERRLPGHGPLGIVHRDISPQNILLGLGGEVKVTDFGIAKAVIQSHETQTGVLKGKYAYMSPEQAEGRALDHRSDLFSMGIVLWELLFGERLFASSNEIQTLEKVRRAEIPWPEPRKAKLYPGLPGVLTKALARNREERFGSAEEFQDALEDCLPRQRRLGHQRLAKVFFPIMGRKVAASTPQTPPPRQTQVAEAHQEATVSLVEAPEEEWSTSGSTQVQIPQTTEAQKAVKPRPRFLPWALLALWLGLAITLTVVVLRGWQEQAKPLADTARSAPAPRENEAKRPDPHLQVLGPPVPRMGEVNLSTVPKGAHLQVELGHRIEQGQGQVKMAGLPAGSEITYEANLKGYKPSSGKIKIDFPLLNVEETITLEKKPPEYGTLKVNVSPTWGRVYVSGLGARDTPAVFPRVREGTHRVRVVRSSDQKALHGRAVIRSGRSTTCSGNWNRGYLSCR